MRALALLRWELVATARGMAPHVTATLVALASAGLVGMGILGLSLWSPFTQITQTFPGRTDPTNAPSLTPVIGEFRGGVAFIILLVWVLIAAGLIGPALTTGGIVRDRASGRLDRILTDAGRSDVVALTKLMGALVPLLFILLTVAPSASFAWLVGGLPTGAAVASLGVVLATIVLIAAIGLFCAAVAGTEVTALLTSAVFVGVLLIGPLLASVGFNVAGLRPMANLALSFDPFVALLTSQPDLATKLVKLIPADLPSPQVTWVIGRFALSFWAIDAVGYLLIAGMLVGLTSIVIEPLHPVKTWRLRSTHLIENPT